MYLYFLQGNLKPDSCICVPMEDIFDDNQEMPLNIDPACPDHGKYHKGYMPGIVGIIEFPEKQVTP